MGLYLGWHCCLSRGLMVSKELRGRHRRVNSFSWSSFHYSISSCSWEATVTGTCDLLYPATTGTKSVRQNKHNILALDHTEFAKLSLVIYAYNSMNSRSFIGLFLRDIGHRERRCPRNSGVEELDWRLEASHWQEALDSLPQHEGWRSLRLWGNAGASAGTWTCRCARFGAQNRSGRCGCDICSSLCRCRWHACCSWWYVDWEMWVVIRSRVTLQWNSCSSTSPLRNWLRSIRKIQLMKVAHMQVSDNQKMMVH